MKIMRAGSIPSAPSVGPESTFTGVVRRDQMFTTEPPGNIATGLVTFEPCARTDWHVHPRGQILIVTAGCGWVQSWGQDKHVIRPGDVVWTPPEEKHWHGATPQTSMSHLAITEMVNGSAVDWLEKVTEDQYHAGDAIG